MEVSPKTLNLWTKKMGLGDELIVGGVVFDLLRGLLGIVVRQREFVTHLLLSNQDLLGRHVDVQQPFQPEILKH